MPNDRKPFINRTYGSMPPVEAVFSFDHPGAALFDGPIVWALDAFPDQAAAF